MTKHLGWWLIVAVLTSPNTVLNGPEALVVICPPAYPRALRNPHKGFTNRGFGEDNQWATLVHVYIPWNQIEDHETDGIDRIKQWCHARWQSVAERNQKVIPRVYLHWSGDRTYWPADMQTYDYSSDQFVFRLTRLVERLGICWDTDPRVAHIEMGIIGKWGEQHSPAPSEEMQRILGNAFARAFVHKHVLVRHPWREFLDYDFGAYWDSWAHADQMDSHGAGLASLTNRWCSLLIGGEVAYDWGHYAVQPGDSPTDTVSDPLHRDFLIDTIRSLHCTQLRWVADYDQSDPIAQDGAEEVQRAFGYRFVLEEMRYPGRVEPGETFEVAFDVRNTGSAPFYYDWPVELSLLDMRSAKPMWRSLFASADIRRCMPGDQWATNRGIRAYAKPARSYTVSEAFTLDEQVEPGEYYLALAVLDPAGELPCLRLAIKNYFIGGRHPIGRIGVSRDPLRFEINPRRFADPYDDKTLGYNPQASP